MEGEVWDQPLLSHGDYKKEEERVERTFLEILEGKLYSKKESGRCELAEDILRENNSLTLSVIVNWLWIHVFGRGLVASADNFGRLGKEPSHLEVLDALAIDFRASGWKMKPFVKQLVISRMFRFVSLPLKANGGAMTEQTIDGHSFDSIVFGEQDPGQWLSGSDNFARTEGFGGPQEKEVNAKAVRIAIVYHQGGRIEGYRDGRCMENPFGRRLLTSINLADRRLCSDCVEAEVASCAEGQVGDLSLHVWQGSPCRFL